MKIYWIWEPTPGMKIGITEDGRLVSTQTVITEEDIMTTFTLPKNNPLLDNDMKDFQNKEKSSEITFEPGKLPHKYIEETYNIIEEYYNTIKDYQPSITPIEPEKIKSLKHGPHYIVTPPMIQSAERDIERIRDLMAKISKRSQEIMIPREKIQELLEKLAHNKLTSFAHDVDKKLGNHYFYFNCCNFRWYCEMVEHTLLAGESLTLTRIEVGFSPRNDIDILMFYDKMKKGEIWVDDIEKFRKEFEETIFPIPTENTTREALQHEKERIIYNSDEIVHELAVIINKIARIWKCAMSNE